MNFYFHQRIKWLGLSFLLGCVLSTSCVREHDVLAEPIVSVAPVDNPYYVSPEKALAVLAAFEGNKAETRTAEREIAAIEVLSRSAVVPETRAGEAAEDAPLAYVVNFKEGGYAVVGADARQGGVIALVKKGSLGAETLAASKRALDTAKGEVDLHTYINGTTVTALLDLTETPQTRIVSGGEGPVVGGDFSYFKTVEYQAPLLCTEWTQWAPYNTKCSWKMGKQVPVGCQAQAMAQVLIYNQSVHRYGSTTIEGPLGEAFYTPYWYLLGKAIETPTPAREYLNEVTNFLYQLGVKLGMKYSPTQSTTGVLQAVALLSDYVGYKNVSYKESVSMDDIRQLVYVKKAPIEVDGGVQKEYHSDNLDLTQPGDHIWVVDGWEKVEYEHKIPVVNTLYYSYHTYVHCRFGYGGELDGWYMFDGKESSHKVYYGKGLINYTLE